ncbi:hypothetical protein CYMTET_17208, partial [Cymbomonas tetramitiformis]
DQAFNKCLIAPFLPHISGTMVGSQAQRTAMVGAWVTFLHMTRTSSASSDDGGVEHAWLAAHGMQALKMLEDGTAGAPAGAVTDAAVHARGCVLLIVQSGVVDHLSEAAQRHLLQLLVDFAKKEDGQVALGAAALVAVLQVVAHLVGALGEVEAELREGLEGVLFQAATSPNNVTQLEAAFTLRALAMTDPTAAGRLLERALAELPQAREEAKSVQKEQQSAAAHKMVGLSTLVGVLLAGAHSLPLGLPSWGEATAVQCAKELVRGGTSAEKTAGWTLVAVLIQTVPECMVQPYMMHGQIIPIDPKVPMLDLGMLWSAAFNPTVVQQIVTNNMPAIPKEMRWRCVALEALAAYVRVCISTFSTSSAAAPSLQRSNSSIGPGGVSSGASTGPISDKPAMLEEHLKHILKGITVALQLGTCAALSEGSQAAQLDGERSSFILRLLEVLQLLPDLNSFKSLHSSLLKLCTATVLDENKVSPSSMVARAASGCVESGLLGNEAPGGTVGALLRERLEEADVALGPWIPGRDKREEAVRSFVCGADAPLLPTWRWGEPGGGSLTEAFPQSRSLELQVETARLDFIGRLLPVVGSRAQTQLLQGLRAAIQAYDARKIRGARRTTMLTYISAVALAAFKPLHASVESQEVSTVRGLLVDLAELVRTDAAAGMAHWRAGAELAAVGPRLGAGGRVAAAQLRSVCGALSVDPPPGPGPRAALALAVGCLMRTVGSMAFSAGNVQEAINVLLECARRPSGTVHVWALHALWLLADAVGPGFIRTARTSLDLTLSLLMCGDAAAPGLAQAVGRVINALVAALGPELQPDGDEVVRCRAQLLEVQAGGGRLECFPPLGHMGPAGREPGAEPWVGVVDAAAQLECVRWTQQLVLFAPHLMPTATHVRALRQPLASRQPAMRAEAASALRLLGQRDPQGVLAEGLEEELFAALDRETDPRILDELWRTLHGLLATGCPVNPKRWLRLLSHVALAVPTKASASMPPAAARSREDLEGDGGFFDEDDEPSSPGGGAEAGPRGGEEAGNGDKGRAGEGTSRAGGMGAAGGTAGTTAPRWRTRVFAAECLCAVPSAVGMDPCHFDLARAREAGGEQWLVLHLQEAVDVGYKVATGQAAMLRPFGLNLLQRLLQSFEGIEDPFYEGHALLEQYQAQLVSALRSAFEEGAPAPVQAAGVQLAAALVAGDVAAGERAVLQRVLGLIIRPLDDTLSPGPLQHAEWVDAQVRISLLEAHARIAVEPEGGAGGGGFEHSKQSFAIVKQLQQPHLRTLLQQWVALLRDHAVLHNVPPDIVSRYTPALVSSRAATAVEPVRGHYEAAWACVLDAATCCASVPPAHGAAADPTDVCLTPDDYNLLLAVSQLAVLRTIFAGGPGRSRTTRGGRLPQVGRCTSGEVAPQPWLVGRSSGISESPGPGVSGQLFALEASPIAKGSGRGKGTRRSELRVMQALVQLTAPGYHATGYLEPGSAVEVLALLTEVVQSTNQPPLAASCAAVLHNLVGPPVTGAAANKAALVQDRQVARQSLPMRALYVSHPVPPRAPRLAPDSVRC